MFTGKKNRLKEGKPPHAYNPSTILCVAVYSNTHAIPQVNRMDASPPRLRVMNKGSTAKYTAKSHHPNRDLFICTKVHPSHVTSHIGVCPHKRQSAKFNGGIINNLV
jgi:hypothetical protein